MSQRLRFMREMKEKIALNNKSAKQETKPDSFHLLEPYAPQIHITAIYFFKKARSYLPTKYNTNLKVEKI